MIFSRRKAKSSLSLILLGTTVVGCNAWFTNTDNNPFKFKFNGDNGCGAISESPTVSNYSFLELRKVPRGNLKNMNERKGKGTIASSTKI